MPKKAFHGIKNPSEHFKRGQRNRGIYFTILFHTEYHKQLYKTYIISDAYNYESV